MARSITGHAPDYEVLARDAELAGASRLAWPAPRNSSEAIDDAALSWESVAPPTLSAGTSWLRMEPILAMRRSGGSVGFVGRF